MNSALQLLVCNLASLASVICAGYMGINDKEGWGWFLFAAMILATEWKGSK